MSTWPMTRLGAICEKITDGTHHSPSNYPSGDFKYVTAKNIKPWGLDLTDISYIDARTHREIYARCDVRKDDVLYVKDGATTGRVALNTLEEEFSLLSSVAVLRPGPALRPKYLMYALQEANVLDRMLSAVAGVAITRLTLRKLNEAEIPLAPVDTQDRIVDKLEELLSDLDAGVAELKAAQKKLAQYRQSLLKATVEGQLTAAWREQNGVPEESGAQLLERILRERRARWEVKELAKFRVRGKVAPTDWRDKYPVPAAPDMSGLPGLPKGWVWSSLGQCFYVGVGATPSRKQSEYWNGNTPWVSSGEVRFNRICTTKERISTLGLQNSSTQINPVGSVMLGMIGEGKTRGQVAILDIEAANNQNCAAIWVPETDIPSEYIYYWLWSRYDETRRDSSGNNQPALNKSIVEAIPFPLPPASELTAIVRLVDAGIAEAFRQDETITHALRQSAAQRKNILKAAFSGQLVPQDPNDEPASVLLERIRIERAARFAAGTKRGHRARTTS